MDSLLPLLLLKRIRRNPPANNHETNLNTGLRGGERITTSTASAEHSHLLNTSSLLLDVHNANASNDQDQYVMIDVYNNEEEQQSLKKQERGLVNLGNTCYLNAALQAMMGLPRFCEDLSRPEVVKFMLMNNKNKHQSLYKALLTVAVQLHRIPEQYRGLCLEALELEEDREDSYSSFDVNPMIVKEAIDTLTSNFIGYYQQDAHEFLTEVIDRLHDEFEAALKSEEKDGKGLGGDCNLSNAVECEMDVDSDEADISVELGAEKSVQRPHSLSYSEMNLEEIDNLLHPKKKEKVDDSTSTPLKLQENIYQQSTVLNQSTEDISSEKVNCDLQCSDSIEAQLDIFDDGKVETCVVKHNTIIPDIDMKADSCDEEDEFILVQASKELVSNASHASKEVSLELPVRKEVSKEEFKGMSSECNLPTAKHFCTEIDVSLTCDSCSYSRSRKEMYRHLSLDVVCGDNSVATSTIEEGLRRFFAPQKLDLKCEKCFCNSATQRMEISRQGDALLLHLKRFEMTMNENFEVSTKKILKEVEFGDSVDLSYFCSNGGFCEVGNQKVNGMNNSDDLKVERIALEGSFDACDSTVSTAVSDVEYDTLADKKNESLSQKEQKSTGLYNLRSVIHHIGSTSSCGHYTADALFTPRYRGNKVNKSAKNKQWVNFNDSVTRRIRKHEVLDSQETAYLLMYELSR